MGPEVKGNPLHISVYLLIVYIFGEFIFPKYPLFYLLNLFGVFLIIVSINYFFLLEMLFMHTKKILCLKQEDKIIKREYMHIQESHIYLLCYFILEVFNI